MLLTLVMQNTLAKAKATQDKQYEAVRAATAPSRAARRGALWDLGEGPPKVEGPCSCPPLVTDSEWLALSAEEQLAWAKNTQDPRIAVGFQSPLEKKIMRLGGVQSAEVRKLLAKKLQQEKETLHKLKVMSFGFGFAKAVTDYQRQQLATLKEATPKEAMLKEAWGHKMAPQGDTQTEGGNRPTGNTEEKTRDYLVPERELEQIKNHIYRVKRARGLKEKCQRLPQKTASERLFTKRATLREDEMAANSQKTQRTKAKKPKAAWVTEQIKRHQERMVRGRRLAEQRKEKQDAQKLSTQVTPARKPPAEKPPEEAKEFEWVTAYPICQPHQDAPKEVTVLMEKPKTERIKKPLPRELLSVPPFLRSQLNKNKTIF